MARAKDLLDASQPFASDLVINASSQTRSIYYIVVQIATYSARFCAQVLRSDFTAPTFAG